MNSVNNLNQEFINLTGFMITREICKLFGFKPSAHTYLATRATKYTTNNIPLSIVAGTIMAHYRIKSGAHTTLETITGGTVALLIPNRND